VILDFNAGDLIQLHGQPTNYKLSRGAYTAAGLTNMQGVIINRVSAGAIDETIGFVRGASLATLTLADSSQFIYAGLIR
jgi:hypothetical protein